MTIGFDTMVAAHLLNEELPLSLLSLCSMALGVDDWGKGRFDFGEKESPPSNLYGENGMGTYCSRDVAYTHLFYEYQRAEMRDNQDQARLMKYLALPGLEALTLMEINGIWVDVKRIHKRRELLHARCQELVNELLEYLPEEFRETADFGNTHFVRKWIFGRKPEGLGLDPITFTAKGVAQTGEKVLKALNHAATNTLLKLKKNLKAITFLNQWEEAKDEDDRIHPRFNPTGTVTGRRSCSDPNLQQVPRDRLLRSCLGAPKGWRFLEVDYSTLEVRIAAWFAEEETMLKVFADGRDIYRYTSSMMYEVPEKDVTKEMRQAGKVVVLGFIYRLSAGGFVNYARDVFGVNFTYEEAVAFRKKFFDTYPRFMVWHNKQMKAAEKNFFVQSPYGRRRNLMSVLSVDEYVRGKAQRQSINSPVQGTGGDFNLASMISLVPKLDPTEIMLVGDIHDALLFQIREDVWEKWAYLILKTMENPPALAPFKVKVPVRMVAEGKIGHYWGSGEEFRLEQFESPTKIRADWAGWENLALPEEDDDVEEDSIIVIDNEEDDDIEELDEL